MEFALTVPLLLMLLIGTVDLGRGFYYAIGISSATRAAALTASRNPAAAVSQTAVRQMVCNETGWVAYADAAACTGLASLEVTCEHVTTARNAVAVHATFRYSLVSFYLAPLIGDPAATAVTTTYELTNESAIPCSQP